MFEDIVIDKKMFKVMKYIYRRNEVSISKLKNHFPAKGNDNVVPLILVMCSKNLAMLRMSNRVLTYDVHYLDQATSVGLTPEGNKYVEDRRESLLKWVIPIVISVLSLTLSFISLFVAIIKMV